MIYNNLTELIGNTPLVYLRNYSEQHKIAPLIAKVESFNPLSSVKDRVGLAMVEEGLKDGTIDKDTTLIEATSGNTGIGIAFVGANFGLKVVIVMPDTMSIERRQLLAALGATLILTDGAKGMSGAIERSIELQKNTPNSKIMGQFVNPANTKAHRDHTGPEIWNGTKGKIDVFVSGIGTGGTISGVGEYLKSKNPNIKIVGVEPLSSPVLTKGVSGPHKIQGIGAGFVPEILAREILDEVITVSNEDAKNTACAIAKSDGILCGFSSGAAIYAGTQLAKTAKYKDKNIVVLLPDTGERYLSAGLFE